MLDTTVTHHNALKTHQDTWKQVSIEIYVRAVPCHWYRRQKQKGPSVYSCEQSQIPPLSAAQARPCVIVTDVKKSKSRKAPADPDAVAVNKRKTKMEEGREKVMSNSNKGSEKNWGKKKKNKRFVVVESVAVRVYLKRLRRSISFCRAASALSSVLLRPSMLRLASFIFLSCRRSIFSSKLSRMM